MAGILNNLKGLSISNRDAVPPVLNDSYFAWGPQFSAFDYITTAASDLAGSTYRLLQVPSNARLHSLDMQTGAMGSGCTFDVGVYYPTVTPSGIANNSAAISEAFFASAVNVSSAYAQTNVLNIGTLNTIPKQQQNLWQALGLAADPICMLDICITVTASAPVVNAALASLKCTYSI